MDATDGLVPAAFGLLEIRSAFAREGNRSEDRGKEGLFPDQDPGESRPLNVGTAPSGALPCRHLKALHRFRQCLRRPAKISLRYLLNISSNQQSASPVPLSNQLVIVPVLFTCFGSDSQICCPGSSIFMAMCSDLAGSLNGPDFLMWILYAMHNHFRLKHEARYSHHPNLAQYFVPITDVEFRQRLERHQGEIAIMLRSSEFNQEKTTLIVTNNPLPLLITGQHLSSPFRYFPKDLLGGSAFSHKPSDLPPLRTPQKQLTSAPAKKWRKPVQFRYATEKDFDSEARFSRGYAERRLQRLYPNLRAYSRLDQQQREPLPSIQGFAARTTLWEPLTMSCLTETKPTINVPGDNGFRYGKAPLWVVNSSVVPKNGK
ncbi:hypothetical protein JRQ81_015520 [Phrynocephalus forsythii]|uniref:Uncharacterized protein n=1 Tax=Phrynocephalus forsythii TaxID=171643 RepID=A0A9Q1B1H9_9SAUR|nr:hypothetical protein JRQ81_015520 [Phrynocephalus forsythii]